MAGRSSEQVHPWQICSRAATGGLWQCGWPPTSCTPPAAAAVLRLEIRSQHALDPCAPPFASPAMSMRWWLLLMKLASACASVWPRWIGSRLLSWTYEKCASAAAAIAAAVATAAVAAAVAAAAARPAAAQRQAPMTAQSTLQLATTARCPSCRPARCSLPGRWAPLASALLTMRAAGSGTTLRCSLLVSPAGAQCLLVTVPKSAQ